MVATCAVKGCKSRDLSKTTANGADKNDVGIRFFRIPKVRNSSKCLNYQIQELVQRRRTEWLRAAGREGSLKETSFRICSLHFLSGEPAPLEKTDDIDWTPSVFNNVIPEQQMECIKRQIIDRSVHQASIMVKQSEILDMLANLDEVHCTLADNETEGSTEKQGNDHSGNENEAESLIATTPSDINLQMHCFSDKTPQALCAVEDDNRCDMIDMKSYRQLMDELQRRTTEVLQLRVINEQLALKQVSFIDNDEKVKFFTGLSKYKTMSIILKKINPTLDMIVANTVDTPTLRLENFQKLLLTLMKLRRNSTFGELAYQFRITQRTASRVFHRVLYVFDYVFENFIHWPDRESMRIMIPKSFESRFGKRVAVIIDCFEIEIERPSALKARNQTFSQYKQKNTAKYLIGITPQGAISFISEGYGGRASDEQITEECGIIEKLQPGDIVLADRGFTVNEILAVHQIELKCPAFKGTRNQMHPVEIEASMDISSVRIHVERIIGQLRQKYTILCGPITIETLKKKNEKTCLVDRIVRVACILSNLCEPIVPM